MNCRRSALFGFVFLILALALFTVWQMLPTGQQDAIIQIETGADFSEIGNQLEEEGWIRSSLMWQLAGVLTRKSNTYFAGTYQFTTGMGLLSILDDIHQGNQYMEQIRLTIPEGSTIEQIASYVENTGLMSAEDFLKVVKSIPREGASSQVLYPLEGYLFPETYFLHTGMSTEEIIEMLQNQFERVLADIEIPEDFAYSQEELIILASIVEKESQDPDEIALVAGVFLNRLEIEMALQSCATVNYILKQDKLILSEEDITVDSPFNTYMYNGLPPGPVGNPGKAAIEAVLHPEKSEYYYFVAGPDGTHHFSETYEEHVWWSQKLWGD